MFTEALTKLVDKLSPEDKEQWDQFQHGIAGTVSHTIPRVLDAPAVLPAGNAAPSRRRGRPPKERGTMTTQTAQTAQAPASNRPTFEQIRARAKELGAQVGSSRDVGVKFYYSLVEAAFHSAATLDKNKHGTGVDDAMVLTQDYMTAQGTAAVFDAKPANQRTQLSKVRQCLKLGGKASLGETVMNITDDYVAIRKKLKANASNAGKLDDASNSFLRFVRAQLKSDTPLTTEVMTRLCFKTDKGEVTPDSVLEGIRRKAKNLFEGKSGPSFQAAGVMEISKICTDLLKGIAQARSQGATI